MNNVIRKRKPKGGIKLSELIDELTKLQSEVGDVDVWVSELSNGLSGILEHVQISKANSEMSSLDYDIVELITRRLDVDIIDGLQQF